MTAWLCSTDRDVGIEAMRSNLVSQTAIIPAVSPVDGPRQEG